MDFRYDRVPRPAWQRDDIDLRDPAVTLHDGLAYLYFTHYDYTNRVWHIGMATTEDFVDYSEISLISPSGYASPGNVIRVGDEFVICYQQYREFPHTICLARSTDLRTWGEPQVVFNTGPDNVWNIDGRVIDPYLVEGEGRYYCYYTGSTRWGRSSGHNLIGVAASDDLETWEDLTPDRPAIGVDHEWEEPDGNENNCVIRRGDRWFMLYSAALARQQIAWAESDDLVNWEKGGLCDVPRFEASAVYFGAPFIIQGLSDDGVYHMLYQARSADERMSFILLESTDLVRWR